MPLGDVAHSRIPDTPSLHYGAGGLRPPLSNITIRDRVIPALFCWCRGKARVDPVGLVGRPSHIPDILLDIQAGARRCAHPYRRDTAQFNIKERDFDPHVLRGMGRSAPCLLPFKAPYLSMRSAPSSLVRDRMA